MNFKTLHLSDRSWSAPALLLGQGKGVDSGRSTEAAQRFMAHLQRRLLRQTL